MDLLYGLIGYPLSHSWSEGYFSEKFRRENIHRVSYKSFPLKDIKEFILLVENYPNLIGLNVTIPYKEQIIPYLNSVSDAVEEIGAVNTIRIFRDHNGIFTKGFNTDVNGFEKSLEHFQIETKGKVLILGSGGASKAASWVLQQKGYDIMFATRRPSQDNHISYEQLKDMGLDTFGLIVNSTPLGMYPNTDKMPELPYDTLTEKHILFDLIYNPSETQFLKQGKERGCRIVNGLYMLEQQAEKSWEIWNS
jgi:shikimate dehydrogenase